ncbi:hypothetical protein [Brevibacillus dissolubilis]|uniref:hypothetical protein n=1 Tax=Brevibacillus dissolubilis TaxID=1844116 RepID=UPI00111681FD|nr:hypothetical protein [Brevibacillus dissolubilis]
MRRILFPDPQKKGIVSALIGFVLFVAVIVPFLMTNEGAIRISFENNTDAPFDVSMLTFQYDGILSSQTIKGTDLIQNNYEPNYYYQYITAQRLGKGTVHFTMRDKQGREVADGEIIMPFRLGTTWFLTFVIDDKEPVSECMEGSAALKLPNNGKDGASLYLRWCRSGYNPVFRFQ